MEFSKKQNLPDTINIKIETSLGNIECELWCKKCPLTCQNFLELSKRGYYNDNIFHRVIPQFIAQTGDKTGTGLGAVSIYDNQAFKNEIFSNLRFDRKGLIGMANIGENKNYSQFFFTLDKCNSLNGKNTLFGKLFENSLWFIDELNLLKVDQFDRPIDSPKILKIEISNENQQVLKSEIQKKKKIKKKLRKQLEDSDEEETVIKLKRKDNNILKMKKQNKNVQQMVTKEEKYIYTEQKNVQQNTIENNVMKKDTQKLDEIEKQIIEEIQQLNEQQKDNKKKEIKKSENINVKDTINKFKQKLKQKIKSQDSWMNNKLKFSNDQYENDTNNQIINNMQKSFFKEEVLQYIQEHNIENFLTDALNSVVDELPDQPYQIIKKQMVEKTKGFLSIKNLKLIHDYNKEFQLVIQIVLCIESCVDRKEFVIDLCESQQDNIVRNELRDYLFIDGQINQENLKSLELAMQRSLENKNLYYLEQYNRAMKQMSSQVEQSIRQQLQNIFYQYHLYLHLDFLDKNIKDYFDQQNLKEPQNFADQKVFVKIFQGGNYWSNNIIYNFDSIYILVSTNLKQQLIELFKLLRKEIVYSKGGYNQCYQLQDGSFLPFQPMFTDNIKQLQSIVQKSGINIDMKFCVDIQSENFYKEGAYLIQGKKDLQLEEYEDQLIKQLLDFKDVQYIIDPIHYSQGCSYHRFNYKMKQKQLNQIQIGSSNINKINYDQFNNIKEEDFGKMKPEEFQKLKEDYFKFDFYVSNFEKEENFQKMMKNLKMYEKMRISPFLKNQCKNQIDNIQKIVKINKMNYLGSIHDKV